MGKDTTPARLTHRLIPTSRPLPHQASSLLHVVVVSADGTVATLNVPLERACVPGGNRRIALQEPLDVSKHHVLRKLVR